MAASSVAVNNELLLCITSGHDFERSKIVNTAIDMHATEITAHYLKVVHMFRLVESRRLAQIAQRLIV